MTARNDITLLGPVEGLDEATILGPCVLGHPARDPDVGPLRLGAGVVIRAYAVLYQGTRLGAGVHVGHHAMIREGNVIGEGSSVGTGAHLEPGNDIGARTRVHSGGFLSSVTLGDDVFCGPNVTFTDDPHPPCPSYLECVGGAEVHDGTSIGARSVILPGVVVGRGVLVGAGSVVTSDVADDMVVAGVPAREVGLRSELDCQAGIYPRAYAWLDAREDVPGNGSGAGDDLSEQVPSPDQSAR